MAKAKKTPKNAQQTVLTLSLRRAKRESRPGRTAKAIYVLRNELAKHMHVPPKDIRLSNDINRHISQTGYNHLPSKIRVAVLKEENHAQAFLDKTNEIDAFLKKRQAAQKQKEEQKTKEKKEEAKAEKATPADAPTKEEDEEKKREEKRIKEQTAQQPGK